MRKKFITTCLIFLLLLLMNIGVAYAAETWVWPTPSIAISSSSISTPFGNGHEGIDIVGPLNTPVVAARDGTVCRVIHGDIPNDYVGAGNAVVINHGGGIYSHYAHLNSTAVSVGQSVSAGTVIGYMGSTGNSTGVHLHFAIATNTYGGGSRINNNIGAVNYVLNTNSTITFDSQGGSSGPSPIQVVMNTSTNFAINGLNNYAPTKAGATFLGWYDSQGVQIYDESGWAVPGKYWTLTSANHPKECNWKYNGNVTAYAKWKHEHSYGTWKTIQVPTCTADGLKERVCASCGDKITEVIPAKGHAWSSWEQTKAPTCSEKGEMVRICSNDPAHKETAETEIDPDAHSWDGGKITKEATTTEDGVRTYTCTLCNKTKEEVIPKKAESEQAPGSSIEPTSGGTAVGPGASAAAAEKAIMNMATDSDPKGTLFSKLTVRSPKQTKNSISLKWTKPGKASKYVIYGNKCGNSNKPMKLATVSGTAKTFKKLKGKKLKKGTYYKFVIVALDKNNTVVSTSKIIHVATKGGKVGNHKSVTVKKSVISKAKKLKKGKSLKLKAKAVPQSLKLKVKKHVAVRYESTNKKVATVNKNGVVKAKKKGSCYVYAYAQNGVFKKVKIVVK